MAVVHLLQTIPFAQFNTKAQLLIKTPFTHSWYSSENNC